MKTAPGTSLRQAASDPPGTGTPSRHRVHMVIPEHPPLSQGVTLPPAESFPSPKPALRSLHRLDFAHLHCIAEVLLERYGDTDKQHSLISGSLRTETSYSHHKLQDGEQVFTFNEAKHNQVTANESNGDAFYCYF